MSELFPEGCTCISYGHGLTMTRVTSGWCPVHGSERQPAALCPGPDGNGCDCKQKGIDPQCPWQPRWPGVWPRLVLDVDEGLEAVRVEIDIDPEGYVVWRSRVRDRSEGDREFMVAGARLTFESPAVIEDFVYLLPSPARVAAAALLEAADAIEDQQGNHSRERADSRSAGASSGIGTDALRPPAAPAGARPLIRERLADAIDAADAVVYKGSGLTSYGPATPERWLEPFLSALAERGLAIVEADEEETAPGDACLRRLGRRRWS